MSVIKANQWLNPDGTENYKCRAWVNFNGTGTVAIRAAGNVSSITDNGVGDYTVNFTSAMPDANYSGVAIPGSTSAINNYSACENTTSRSASAFRVQLFASATLYDLTYASVAVFR